MSMVRSLRLAVALLLVCGLAVAVAAPVLAAGGGSLFIPFASSSEPLVHVADNLQNDVVTTGVDQNDTFTAGGSTTITYRLVANAAQGDINGCNVDASYAATLSITVPDGVSASPSSVQFTACGNLGEKSVTFSSSNPGNYSIGHSISGGKEGAKYSNQADFTLHVLAPTPSDNTPPSISYVLNPASPDGANGWYKSNVTLTWTVSEPESPSSLVKTGCVDQNITADQAATTYSCSATSDGGSAGPVSVSIKRDATDPEVSVTGVSDGATYDLGSVPAAGCDTTDDTSGVATEATLSSSGGPVGSITATCDGAEDYAGNAAAPVSVTYDVHYIWTGFFQPVDNNSLNVAKAGSAIPVKFNLGGNQGLSIFAVGYPLSGKINCTTNASEDAIEETVNAGGSSLTYDTTANQYVYVWKTDKTWANSCRQLQVKLTDGTTHTANFKFNK